MSIYTFENLYRAYLDCREHKRKTANALEFEFDQENKLRHLLEDLKRGSYRPGRSICFVVTEPCPREIFAADFRDRIVHHLFVRELIKKAERMFIYDSYACRRGKGTHKAVKRANDFLRQISSNFKQEAWYMKIDIASFFMSIDKNKLYLETLDMIDSHKRPDSWKNEMADLAGIIIFHRPQEDFIRKGDPGLAKLVPAHKSLIGCQGDNGLPIGNYSSQFFANLYMNKLDHFIKRNLKCRHYARYVDDLVFFSRKKEQLEIYHEKICNFLKEKSGLRLNERKTIIETTGRGLDFLGYFLKQNKIFTRRNVVRRYKNKLFPAAIGSIKISWPRLQAIAASYRGNGEYFLC